MSDQKEGRKDCHNEISDTIKLPSPQFIERKELMSIKRPRIDASEPCKKLESTLTYDRPDKLADNLLADCMVLQDSSNKLSEILFCHSQTSSKKSASDDDYTSDADEYPLYTQQNEGSLISDSLPHIHLIMDEEDIRKLRTTAQQEQPYNNLPDSSHSDEGNVALDRIWLSPPSHRKLPRVGSSYQVDVAIPPSDREHT